MITMIWRRRRVQIGPEAFNHYHQWSFDGSPMGNVFEEPDKTFIASGSLVRYPTLLEAKHATLTGPKRRPR